MMKLGVSPPNKSWIYVFEVKNIVELLCSLGVYLIPFIDGATGKVKSFAEF